MSASIASSAPTSASSRARLACLAQPCVCRGLHRETRPRRRRDHARTRSSRRRTRSALSPTQRRVRGSDGRGASLPRLSDITSPRSSGCAPGASCNTTSARAPRRATPEPARARPRGRHVDARARQHGSGTRVAQPTHAAIGAVGKHHHLPRPPLPSQLGATARPDEPPWPQAIANHGRRREVKGPALDADHAENRGAGSPGTRGRADTTAVPPRLHPSSGSSRD